MDKAAKTFCVQLLHTEKIQSMSITIVYFGVTSTNQPKRHTLETFNIVWKYYIIKPFPKKIPVERLVCRSPEEAYRIYESFLMKKKTINTPSAIARDFSTVYNLVPYILFLFS